MPEKPSPEYRSHGLSLEEILAQLNGPLELGEHELHTQLESLPVDGRVQYTDRNGHTITVERDLDGQYSYETSEPLK
jgi:hypothetical protein